MTHFPAKNYELSVKAGSHYHGKVQIKREAIFNLDSAYLYSYFLRDTVDVHHC